MPYSKQHKEQTRQKILDSAIKLFSSQGYSQVSIDELMTNAGLTRGAFYAHFKNKKVVYSKAILAGTIKSRINQKKPEGLSNEEWWKDLLMGYLSEDHIQQKISPCPLAFLVTDIANNEKEVRATYTRMFKHLNKTIYAQLNQDTTCSKQEILATTAMMIGGVAIARALNDKEMTSRLLESCQLASLELLKIK